jgi:hypothetical protein
MDVNNKLKFSGTGHSAKRITYTEFSQKFAASIIRVNEFALMTEEAGFYLKWLQPHVWYLHIPNAMYSF